MRERRRWMTWMWCLIVAASLTACGTSPQGRADRAPAEAPAVEGQGEWKWVAIFASGERLEGYLSIAEAGSDQGAWRDVVGGLWRWCEETPDDCDEANGVGVVGNYGADWVTAFSDLRDGSNTVRLLAVDFDGVVGETEDGRMLFHGPGRWYFDSGEYAPVGFSMSRIAEAPVFDSATMPTPASVAPAAARAASLLTGTLRSDSDR
jgi:hypothetical protein